MDPFTTTKTNTSVPVTIVPDNGPDCDRVNTVLDQFIDGQPVAAEDENYLYDHANDCSPCFDDIEKQQVFIQFLKQRVPCPPMPANLHQTIMARLDVQMA